MDYYSLTNPKGMEAELA